MYLVCFEYVWCFYFCFYKCVWWKSFANVYGVIFYKFNWKISVLAIQVALGYSKVYNVQNPFDWMELISLQ